VAALRFGLGNAHVSFIHSAFLPSRALPQGFMLCSDFAERAMVLQKPKDLKPSGISVMVSLLVLLLIMAQITRIQCRFRRHGLGKINEVVDFVLVGGWLRLSINR